MPTSEIPETPLPTVMVEETPGEATPAGTAQIYLVALEDAGQSGQEIGCNDSLVAVEAPGSPTTLAETMAALLAIDEQF
ncbi:MAG TPA: hypothetical protein VF177_20205 [Anaerolineae bacterium]